MRDGWGTKFSCLNKSSVAQEMRKEAAVAGETVSALYKGVKKRPGTQFLISRKRLFELH